MTNPRYPRLRTLHLTSYLLGLMAMLLTAIAAQATDWDSDTIDDDQDWGVALTFDLHPSWEQPAAWNYPGNWATYQPSVLDILAVYEARATFFVSGFANTTAGSPGTPAALWNDLLDDAVDGGHELAWHGREHIDYPKWQNESVSPDPTSEPWPSAWFFVYKEVQCDVSNYLAAKGSHSEWPATLKSYAYPGCTLGNLGNPQANWFLKQYVGHARASDAPSGPAGCSSLPQGCYGYDTETIANQFDLKGLWLDNRNVCVSGTCSVYEILKEISKAYTNKEIVVLAAHHFTTGTGSEFATQMWNLISVLDHINCLQDGGTLGADLLCTAPATPDHSGNPIAYHRFLDLPVPAPLTDVPAGDPAYCQPMNLSSCG